jgi:beta-lactamase regulating signal transducer with metallopeptidase domain
MTPAALMEILTSLTLQTGVITLVAGWLTRSNDDPVRNDRIWSLAYGLIFAVSGCCLLVPHLRWVVFSSLTPPSWQPELYNTLELTARYLSFLWLAGCGVYLCLLVLGMVRGAMLVRSSPLQSTIGSASLDHLPDQIQFRSSSLVNSPFLWQFHQPTIVLPARVLRFDADSLGAILRHEIAHFNAGHPLQLFLQRLVELVFWYHPLVWWASCKTAMSRELRCDWEAVSTPVEAESLLRGLILLLESRRRSRNSVLASLSFLGPSNRLEARTTNLLARFASEKNATEKRRSFHDSVLILVGAVVFSFTLGWLPVNPEASQRSYFSPWPVWSASAMDLLGVQVRDYEVDGHRLQTH